MKTNFKFIIVALIAFSSYTFVSCDDDDNDGNNVPSPTQTISEIAAGNPNLSLLVQALTKTGLAETLDAAGAYTVFAPNNLAFTNAGITSSTIEAITSEEGIANLRNFLLNHVFTTNLTSTQLKTGYRKTLATPAVTLTGNLDMYVSNTTEGIKLNGASRIISANIPATNGTIHLVDGLIPLPTVVTFVQADPNFGALLTCLTRPDQSSQNFVGTLSGNAASPYTVFAPTNTAFNDLLDQLGPTTTLSNITATTLTRNLKYHVVTGANVLSSTLENNQFISTFLGSSSNEGFTIEIVSATDVQIRDSSNRVAKIIATDVQADNGIVHVIDKVLIAAAN